MFTNGASSMPNADETARLLDEARMIKLTAHQAAEFEFLNRQMKTKLGEWYKQTRRKN